MSSKFTLQALALTGILAVSGLPAFASDMTPASPAPNAAIQSNVKGDVSGKSVGAQTKTDAKVIPGDKKDSKDQHSELKTNKDKHEQTAKLPVGSAPAVAPAANATGAAGTSVQH